VRGATPVIWCSGEVERVRGSTVEASGGFIGAGAGNGAGSAWRDAGHAGAGVGRARTRGSLLLLLFYPLLSGQNV
jgi:hypothetical protein